MLIGLIPLLLISVSNRWLFAPITLAYVLRSAVAFVNRYIFELPQGGSDAKVFDRVARVWSDSGCFGFFEHFDPTASYVYSSILASFYACTAPSTFGSQLINVFLGTFSVIILSCGAYRVWGVVAARRCAFVLALFPALIIYSAVTLRESFILFFFSLAIYFIVRYCQERKIIWLVVTFFSIGGSVLFHGGMAFAAVGLMIGIFAQIARSEAGNRKALALKILIIPFGILGVLIFYSVLDVLFIPKIGDLEDIDASTIASVVDSRAGGSAGYLMGLEINSVLDLLWQAPVRMAYLLFAPFPWNIGAVSHIFGLLDGVIYLLSTVLLLKYRRMLFEKPEVFVVFIVLMSLALVFAFGTSNFGTGMRHRAKFYVAMFVLIAPLIPRVSLNRFRYRR